MQLLIVGFDRDATDRISVALRDAGHQVLGATGRSSARTLARVVCPDAVLVPEGGAGGQAWGWVVDLLAGARRVPLDPDGDPAAALERGEGVSLSPPGSGSTEPERPRLAEPESGRDDGADAILPIGAIAGRGPIERASGAGAPPGAEVDAPSPASSTPPDLQAKLAQVRFGDYHSILEVKPGDSAPVIREQHQRLSRLYAPTGWPGPVGAEDIPALDEIGRGIDDARAVLGDPELRARYERALERGGRRIASEPRS